MKTPLPGYPTARQSAQTDTYFGTTVADPYRWMEDVDSAEVKAWVDAENALTQQFLADVPARDTIHARLLALNDYERFSMPQREAGRLFFRRNAGLQNQAVLYWQEGDAGEAQVLLDPNTLAADATVSLENYSISEDGTLMAYALAEAGSDVQTVRVRTVSTGQDRDDRIDWVKFSGVSWAKDGSGFYYSSYGQPEQGGDTSEVLKDVRAFHKLYFHTLGEPQAKDAVVYERPDDGEMLVGGGVSDDGQWLVLSAGKGSTNTLAIRSLLHPEKADRVLAPVDDAIYNFIGNVGGTAYVMTNKDAPRSRVVAIDLEQPEREHWQVVVAEREQPLEEAVMVHETLLLTYMEDAKNKVEQRGLDGTLLRDISLPGIGRAGVAGGRASDTSTYFAFTNYTTPSTLYKLDVLTGETQLWKQPRLQFDPTLYETSLEFAMSKDGTRVPLFVTRKKGLARAGNAPALLYGYGGFNISLGPAFSSSRLAWVEMGGVYAEAILRGGGEYGEAWHEAGTKLNKQNVFDDFIACAELLIAEKFTSPAKLAINGGSNGGLLCAAVELQRPELLGAVVAQVGVMDMLRFDRFTIGYAWKPDYGSPSENEAEFRAILKYSPVHNIKVGTAYPATLIMTADHDDRVFPAHSFKYTAALQSANPASLALIRVETRAGHGAGMPLSKQLDSTADMYGFLVKVLGMELV